MTETDADDIRSACDTCGKSIYWISCPTGGWWAHDNHPADGHDAVTVVEVEEDETNGGRLYTVGIRAVQL